jgi:hypothetical protein
MNNDFIVKNFIHTIVKEQLNEMRVYQGHKIPTENIFFNENPHKNYYDKELLNHIDVFVDDNSFKQNPVEPVDVRKIVPTQKFLNKDNLEKVKGTKKNTGAYLVKYGDLYYVIDGHHRIANLIINGADTINAYVQYV